MSVSLRNGTLAGLENHTEYIHLHTGDNAIVDLREDAGAHTSCIADLSILLPDCVAKVGSSTQPSHFHYARAPTSGN